MHNSNTYIHTLLRLFSCQNFIQEENKLTLNKESSLSCYQVMDSLVMRQLVQVVEYRATRAAIK